MRRSLSILPLLLSAWALPASASQLELEVGGGGATAPQIVGPALTGRIGLDFMDHLTASVRLIGLPISRASTLSTDSSGYQAWAGLGELRLHTSGMFQLSAAAGVGVGALGPGGSTSPYEQASLGARLLVFDMAWVASDLALLAWNTPSNYQPSASANLGGMFTVSVGGRVDLL